MSLVINHNMMAMNASRNLGDSYGRLATSTRRLSSGLRVGVAADDAAGLAIRELMRADISSIHQGIRNANDAISMLQTADGALQIIDEKLIRMKELAEQAATGTYNSTQRLMIESEYQAMASEITRIANATDFNGVHLLDGTLSSPDSHDGSGLTTTGRMKIHFGTGNSSSEDYYFITIGNSTASAFGIGNMSAVSRGIDTAQWTDNGAGTVQIPGEPVGTTQAGTLYTHNGTGEQILVFTGSDGTQRIWHLDPNGNYSWEERPADGHDISTQQNAQRSLDAINEAIVSKDKIRASLGALQNRLENTISNLSIQAENLQASESRISDVDVATEMTEFVRNQILTQTSVAMLAQANALPRLAMQLIGGG